MNGKYRTRILQVIFVLMLLGVGLTAWVFLGGRKETIGVSRALAARQMALALAGQEEIAAAPQQFSAEDRENWYVPYAEYLYGRGLWNVEQLPADRKTMGGALTYRDLEAMAGELDMAEELGRLTEGEKRQGAVAEEEWASFYQAFLEKYDTEGQVGEAERKRIPDHLSDL